MSGVSETHVRMSKFYAKHFDALSTLRVPILAGLRDTQPTSAGGALWSFTAK